MSVLSIQSAVSYGHVGNSAAVFALQRLGLTVWPVNTLQFSNHPGYGAFRGRVFEPGFIGDLVEGIAERGVLGQCDAVLSGYLGDPATGACVLDAVARVKAVNPTALYCCDPVIGDSGFGVYVRSGVPEFFAERGIPAADIVTPNRFELEHFTGRAVASLADALDAADALRARGPRLVLVTSLDRRDGPPETVEMLAVGPDTAWLVATPLLPIAVHGSGDAVAALFLGQILKGASLDAALAATASAIFAVVAATERAGTRELQLVAAQDELAAPRRRFAARRVR